MSDENPTIALLGTGIMGSGMGHNLLEADYDLRVWNRTASKASELVEAGAAWADGPAEAVEGADVVLTMLADGPAVEAVLFDEEDLLGRFEEGATWIQSSTVGLDETERFAARAADHALTFLDAPVLGTRKPAREGTLTALVGGPESAKLHARPILEAFCAKILWVGEAGAGTGLKLVANNWVLGLLAVLGESLALAQRLELDPGLFLEAIDGSALDAAYAHIKGEMMLEEGYDEPHFPLRHALKDANLIYEAAERHGLHPQVIEAVARQFEEAAELGHEDDDMAAIFASSSRTDWTQ
jgi:3-hydroxyisobutyrate dehydrogenase